MLIIYTAIITAIIYNALRATLIDPTDTIVLEE